MRIMGLGCQLNCENGLQRDGEDLFSLIIFLLIFICTGLQL
jgi:hypothetical protein